jgi:hypothetical protein
MNSTLFPKFSAELNALGRTNHERARALAMPLRTFMDWKSSKLPFHVQRIMRPNLLRALADDLEASQQSQPPSVSTQQAAQG